MTDSITYRTTDGTRWGTGQGANLTGYQIDINFWALYSAVTALQDHAVSNQIDYFNAVGDMFFVHFTDHTVLGPYQLPTAQWNFRGPWQPATVYRNLDIVTNNGAVYMVIFDHISNSTFDPGANDGLGHDYYGLLLEQPQDELPAGGTAGQRLVMLTGSPYNVGWINDLRMIGVFMEGQPTAPNELIMQFVVAEDLVLPAGLPGSEAFQNTPTTTNITYPMYQNGASIGGVNFTPTGTSFTFTGDVDLVPGDVLTINAPAIPDGHQSDVSITLVATIVM